MTSLKLDVDSRGLASAAAALERQGFEARAGVTVAYALRRAGNLVRRNVRAEAKSHRRTGKLRDNIRTRAKGRGMDFEMKVYTGGSAAALVVVGAKAHQISPGPVMPLWDAPRQ